MASARDDLKNYCLRKLGHPVVKVNVTESQQDDAVNDTIDLFQEAHNEGTIHTLVKHTITQEEIDQRYIVLPEHVQSVVRVLPLNEAATNSNSMFSPVYQAKLSGLWEMNGGSLVSYELQMQNMNLINSMFADTPNQSFSMHRGRLEMDTDWSRFIDGETIMIIDCFSAVDPEEFTRCYSDRWVKKYCTALIKKQWGTNLKKFTGVALPGGITMDGQTMWSEAVEEIKELEIELESRYQLPIGFQVG